MEKTVRRERGRERDMGIHAFKPSDDENLPFIRTVKERLGRSGWWERTEHSCKLCSHSAVKTPLRPLTFCLRFHILSFWHGALFYPPLVSYVAPCEGQHHARELWVWLLRRVLQLQGALWCWKVLNRLPDLKDPSYSLLFCLLGLCPSGMNFLRFALYLNFSLIYFEWTYLCW